MGTDSARQDCMRGGILWILVGAASATSAIMEGDHDSRGAIDLIPVSPTRPTDVDWHLLAGRPRRSAGFVAGHRVGGPQRRARGCAQCAFCPDCEPVRRV